MKTTRSPNRRNFLLAAGLGGAGAVAAVVTGGAKNVAKPAKQVDAAASETKYRDTEHIRKYYETTKV